MDYNIIEGKLIDGHFIEGLKVEGKISRAIAKFIHFFDYSTILHKRTNDVKELAKESVKNISKQIDTVYGTAVAPIDSFREKNDRIILTTNQYEKALDKVDDLAYNVTKLEEAIEVIDTLSSDDGISFDKLAQIESKIRTYSGEPQLTEIIMTKNKED